MSIRFDSLNNSNFLPTTDNSNNQIDLAKSNTSSNNIDGKVSTDSEVSLSQKNESLSQKAKQVFVSDRNSFSDFRALQINNKLGDTSNLIASNFQKPKQSSITPPNTPLGTASNTKSTSISKYPTLEGSIKEKGNTISSASKSDPQAVKELQTLINTHTDGKDTVGVSGNFDSKTQAAVRAFQRSSGLPVTGVVDNKTLDALQKNNNKISEYYLQTKYTSTDLTKIYDKGDPKGAYTTKDVLVNYIAEGEGGFNSAETLQDGGGLSVGILQWTQNSTRLSELTGKYKEVATQEADKKAAQQVKEEISSGKLKPELAEKRKAELSDKYNEFYNTFGGKTEANKLLDTLKNNATSISPSSITKKFEQAGNKPIFQKAQRELALSTVEQYLPNIISSSPYAKDGNLSKQTIAVSLAINNIGAGGLAKLNNKVVKEKYTELVSKNPKVEEDINKKLNTLSLLQIRETYSKAISSNPKLKDEVEKQLTQFKFNYDKAHPTKGFSPEKLEKAKQERQLAIEQKEAQLKLPTIKEELKRDAVVQNVTEEEFNKRLIELAPSTLYSPANQRRYTKGLNNRLTRLADSASSQEQVNLR